MDVLSGFVGLTGGPLDWHVRAHTAKRSTRPRRTLTVVASGQVRTRQHVNPLSRELQKPIELPENWPDTVFEDLDKPVHVDIGVAKGRFLLEMAELKPERNYVGLEIRRQLVDQANGWRDAGNLKNLDFLFANANVSLDPILSSLPENVVDHISIQFPDPWFKKRHQKRRVLQSELLDVVVKHLKPGGEFYVVSDVLEVAEQMAEHSQQHSGLVDTTPGQWLEQNPYGILTEREKSCVPHGKPVYAKLFRRGQLE